MKKLALILSQLPLVLTLVMPTAALAAKPVRTQPTLYFSKASVTATSGSNLSLPVRLNAAGAQINAVSIVVTLPESQLAYVSLDTTSSYFDAVIPSSPAATGGKITFSVASLAGGPTTGDVLIGNIIIKPLATSGSAKVLLDGSTAANNGQLVSVATNGSSVSLKTGGQKPHTNLAISDVTVSDVTYNGATISWKTNTEASSSLSYGTSDSYGMTAVSDETSTNHSVKIDTPLLAKSVVHFKISASDSEANVATTSDRTFTTKGYLVRLAIVDADGKPIANATVKTADGQVVKTDENGIATLTDIGAGALKVSVNGDDPQVVSIKTTSFDDSAVPQNFQLVANRTAGAATYLSYLVLFLLAIGVGLLAWRQRVPKQNV